MYQLFIEVSGCKGVIDEEMQANLEFAEIIRKMTEEFDEVRRIGDLYTISFSHEFRVSDTVPSKPLKHFHDIRLYLLR